jgi:hypothetical protein
MAANASRHWTSLSDCVISGAALALILTTSCGTPSANLGSGASSPRLESPSASASAPASGLPEARQGGFLVEDPISGHLLLVGGISTLPSDSQGSWVTSTWSWEGQRWQQLNVVSQGILAVFFDSVSKQAFAIQVTGVPEAVTTLAWSGKWVRRNTSHVPTPMSPFSSHAVFNPSTGVAVYCGDYSVTPGLDVWMWDGGDWSMQTDPSPAMRLNYALAYDPITKTDVLFGGRQGGGPNPNFADTWSWSGSGWTLLRPSHSPSPGSAYATFDESLNALVLLDSAGNMWTWTGTDWTAVASSGSGPGAFREDAVFGYDPVSQRVIVFSGSNGRTATATTWLWDGASSSWTQPT